MVSSQTEGNSVSVVEAVHRVDRFSHKIVQVHQWRKHDKLRIMLARVLKTQGCKKHKPKHTQKCTKKQTKKCQNTHTAKVQKMLKKVPKNAQEGVPKKDGRQKEMEECA